MSHLRGIGNGQVKNPQGVAVDRNDNVYVADKNNYRIQKFTIEAAAGITGLEKGVSYDIYVVAEDKNGNLQSVPVKVAVTGYPVFRTGYPRTTNVKTTSLDLLVKLNQAGNCYYQVLDRSAAAPSAADVKNNGVQVAVAGTNEVTASITSGLSAGQSYNIYVVVEGTCGTLQPEPDKLQVTMHATEFPPQISSSLSEIRKHIWFKTYALGHFCFFLQKFQLEHMLA